MSMSLDVGTIHITVNQESYLEKKKNTHTLEFWGTDKESVAVNKYE